MQTALFDFDLSESLIATRPASPRDSARMLVVEDGLQHRAVRELPEFLRAGDILVFNDTKVIPARLYGRRGDAKIEILLHKPTQNGVWSAFAKPGKKLKPGDRIIFSDNFSALVESKSEGEALLRFEGDLNAHLAAHGEMPLPPYIQRLRPADARDRDDYQTVYAREEGSVAAPTAGLHFTPELLAALDAKGVKRAQVTLHVGAGTFQPVKVEDTEDHVMHAEHALLTPDTAAAINAAKAAGGRVIAIGTTSLRTLESATDEQGRVQPMNAETRIFITPGYRFKCVDMLLTNFHLPRSTLFMLVSAFAGTERMKEAYTIAISNNYRFYSYGDTSLLYRRA